jgi:hypothetical protein
MEAAVPIEDEQGFFEYEDLGPVTRHCERCQTLTKCEFIPLMGYSEYLCRNCAAAAYRSGDAI